MMPRLALAALLLLAPAAPVHAGNGVVSSIVQISTTYQEPSYHQPWKMETQSTRSGSGCIVPGRRILTNAHVVSDQTFLQVRRAGQAQRYVADVAAVSHELDLALLVVEDEAFFEGARAVDLGVLPAIGDPVTALGFPEGGTRITITEGIVSRIDRGSYSHSGFSNLVCQIDAAINPGSSGGPVLGEDGKIVGVAFQTGYGENIGYMVPVPVVRHFLKDIEDGRTDGCPVVPFAWQVLDNRQLREHVKLPEGETGILVTQIAPLFEGPSKLLPKDVLLEIDGLDLATDGTVAFRPDERFTFRYAIDRKQVGDTIDLRILRGGKPLDLQLALPVGRRAYGNIVPRRLYDVRPSYYIVGGFVFSPLTSNYYDAWDSWNDVPLSLKRYYYEPRAKKNQDRQVVVVLIDYLADALNVGYDFEDSIVAKVNGRTINSMPDLVDAFESHEGDTHRIQLEDHGWEIVLQRDLLEERGPQILERYGVPKDRSADLESAR